MSLPLSPVSVFLPVFLSVCLYICLILSLRFSRKDTFLSLMSIVTVSDFSILTRSPVFKRTWVSPSKLRNFPGSYLPVISSSMTRSGARTTLLEFSVWGHMGVSRIISESGTAMGPPAERL